MPEFVELTAQGHYEWDLSLIEDKPTQGFWDRFLDGLAENDEGRLMESLLANEAYNLIRPPTVLGGFPRY